MAWYSSKTLLHKKDSWGLRPELFIVMSNRGAGKTYDFCYKLLQDYFDEGKRFALITKFKNSIGGVGPGMFAVVLRDHYPGWAMVEYQPKGCCYAVVELQKDIWDDDTGEVIETQKEHVGYTIAITSSIAIKKCSSQLYDVEQMFFDEFQGDYCPDEVNQFVRIHMSIARGGDEKNNGVRYVPVYLASNTISIDNPYFSMLGCVDKLQSNTKFYRGDGYVVQIYRNEDVAEAQRQSGFNRAFKRTAELAMSLDNTWLNDNGACVAKPDGWGHGISYYNFVLDNQKFGVYEYADVGLWFISRKYNPKALLNFNIGDACENLTSVINAPHVQKLRRLYFDGQVRFNDQQLKNIITSRVF